MWFSLEGFYSRRQQLEKSKKILEKTYTPPCYLCSEAPASHPHHSKQYVTPSTFPTWPLPHHLPKLPPPTSSFCVINQGDLPPPKQHHLYSPNASSRVCFQFLKRIHRVHVECFETHPQHLFVRYEFSEWGAFHLDDEIGSTICLSGVCVRGLFERARVEL